MNSRVCTQCGVDKPIADFGVDRRVACGRKARCKGCYKLYGKNYYRQNKVKWQTDYYHYVKKAVPAPEV